MKKIILILCVLLFAFTAKAQVINVCGTDSVTLEVDNYVNGTIEWQESIDTITWATIPEVSGITYRFLPTQTKYYRAVVKTTDCQPLYSSISLVQLIPIAYAGTDRTIGNTFMTLLGNAVPGATGEWTILSGNGGVLDNSTNPRALLTGINKETYSLKWTLTNACGQSSDTVVIAFDQIIAKNNFIVVDNTDSIFSDSTEMANGTYRIKFSDSTINPADSAMLIGMRSDISFLQRVNTFTLQDSIYTFTTEQGTFEELIKTGVLNIGDAVNQALMLDSPAMQKTKSSISQSPNSFPTRQTLKENSNNKGIKLLYSQNTKENAYPKVRSVSSLTNGDGFIISIPDISMFKIEGTFNASINNSFIRINPNFVLDYTYSFPANLTKLRFGVDNAEIEYNINSKLEVTAPIITNQEEKKIVGVTKYIVFMAGPVPVVITANFDIKASIALDASAGITLEQKKIYKTNITALVVGENVNNLSLIKNSSESSTHEERLTGIAKTSFEFNIGPEISFKAYDFIGPYFKIPAKIKLSFCTNTNNNWSGEASIGYECKLGANAKVLGSTLFDFNYKFLKDDIMGKIELPYQLELLSGNFQKGINGNQLSNPISMRATSNLGFGVPFVPVRFTLEAGNGSVSQNVLLTDALGNVSVNWTLGSNPQNKLKVSVLDCNDNDIENSPMYVYASSASQTNDCTNSSLSIDMKTVNGYMSPSVTGGTAPYTYSTNGADYSTIKPQFNILIPIKQTLFVKDKNLCIRSKTFEIKAVDACASSTLSMDVLVQPDILSITGKGGKTPYLFAVDNTASFTTTSTYYKLSTGKHTVYIKDNNGCMASHDVVIDNVATTAAIRSSYPAQNASSVPINGITFQWVAANYASNQVYDLYLKKGTDDYTLIASNLSNTSYAYNSALVASTAYAWKVAVKTGSTVIDYNEFTFTTASGVATTPTVPVLLQPGNGGSVYSPATLKWTPQTGDFKYDLYLDANNASTLVALNLTTAECTVTNLVIDKTYYWKVKIKSTITGATSTSTIWSFTTLLNTHVTVFVTAGNLASTLSSGLKTITNLKLTGTIDARDFKTMRDEMPSLAELDLSEVTVVAYTGNEGTISISGYQYLPNEIPSSAFLGKISLNSILLPISTTSIGDYAFYNCNGFTSILIPSSVISIDGSAFTGCSANFLVDENNQNFSSSDGILFNKSKSILIHCTISKTGSYTIPKSVTSIGDDAFFRCSFLTSVSIPTTVTSIGNNSFYLCSSLTSIDIPTSVTSLGIYAFSNCYKLNSVNIPISITLIPQNCFDNCNNLTSIIIPSSIKTISFGAFLGCYKLTSIIIPATVTSIGTAAFSGGCGFIIVDANNLNYSSDNGVLFNKTKSILMQCPKNKIGSYTIPSSVTSIEDYAFDYCNTLTSIVFPSSVTNIGGAFRGCSGLKSIYVNGKPAVLKYPSDVFLDINKTTCTLYVPYNAKLFYSAANQWNDFQNIVENPIGFLLDESYAKLTAANSSSATISVSANVTWTTSSDQTWLTVSPNSGTGNGTLSFTAQENQMTMFRTAIITVSSTGVASQTIAVRQLAPAISVTAGGLSSIFSTTELSKITELVIIGTIDARDFKTMRDNMPNLAELDLSGVSVVSYTGTEGTISNNYSYRANEVPSNAFTQKRILKSVIMPNSITSIGYRSFEFCPDLTSIIISSSVTTISDRAFYWCTSLESIYINSKPVDISSSNSVFYNVNKTTCTLYVPYSSKSFYTVTNQWKDFQNIVENTQGFLLESSTTKLAATNGSTNTISVTANVAWTVNSDQTWFTISPSSGTGNGTLTITAQANQTSNIRTALITVSSTSVPSQTIFVKQVAPAISVTAGGLSSILSSTELSEITELALVGTIDARDFKTMRDNMPKLAELDLSGVSVVAYTGTEGT